MRRCQRCRRHLKASAYHGQAKSCRECNTAKREKYHASDRGKRAVYASNLKRYGLTMELYELMLAAQSYRCAICGGDNGSRRLHVDHNHETGQVRALLCSRCNSVVGHVEQGVDVERLRQYVETFRKGEDWDVGLPVRLIAQAPTGQ